MTNVATGTENPAGTPTPVENPSAEGTPSTDQSGGTDWRSILPEDVRSVDTLGKFKDVGALAKSYVELEKHIGGTVKLPTDTAKPEEWEALYNKLGRPEKPEGYEFKKPESLPAGVEWNEDLVKEFSGAAHKAGLSKSQASAMTEFYNGVVNKMAEGFWTPEKASAALEQKFTNTEERNKHIASVQRAVKEFADPEFVEFLDATGAGNNPAVLGFLAKLGNLINEDSLPENFGPGQGGVSVDEAKAEIAKIRNDKGHPYHKGDKEATAYMGKLYEAVYGRQVTTEVR